MAAPKSDLPDPFEHILPNKWMFRPKEVGAVLELSESTIEKLMDAGKLYGHGFNAGSGKRIHRRIVRPSIVTLLLNTRDFEADQQAAAILALLHRLPAVEILEMESEVQKLLHDAKARALRPVAEGGS